MVQLLTGYRERFTAAPIAPAQLFEESHPCDDIPNDRRIPEFDCAIRCGRVTLDQLIEALPSTRSTAATNGVPRVHPCYFPKLLEAYERDHGKIEESYFCKQIKGAAILTQSERKRRFRRKEVALRIHLRYPPEAVVGVSPEFEEALWKCMALSKKATQLLRTQNSRMLHKVMHSTVVYLLTVLDTVSKEKDEANKTKKTKRAVEQADRDLDSAQRQYLDCARWGAQLAYSRGVVLGMLFVILLSGAVSAAVWSVAGTMRFEILYHLLLCLVGGGLGAVVSVMYRMASGKLRPNHHTEHKSLTLLATFRPFVGAIFATAIYVLIWANFLPMTPPQGTNAYYFVAGIAFLSGFSERFAQVSLDGAAKVGGQQQAPAQVLTPPEGRESRRRKEGAALRQDALLPSV